MTALMSANGCSILTVIADLYEIEVWESIG